MPFCGRPAGREALLPNGRWVRLDGSLPPLLPLLLSSVSRATNTAPNDPIRSKQGHLLGNRGELSGTWCGPRGQRMMLTMEAAAAGHQQHSGRDVEERLIYFLSGSGQHCPNSADCCLTCQLLELHHLCGACGVGEEAAGICALQTPIPRIWNRELARRGVSELESRSRTSSSARFPRL